MAKTISLYIDEDLKDRADKHLKSKGKRSFSEYASKLISADLEGTATFSVETRNPIEELFKTYRPSLAKEAAINLKKLPVSETQVLDRLLTSLFAFLDTFDPDEDTTEFLIGTMAQYYNNLHIAQKSGIALSSDSEFAKLVAELPSPYRSKKK